MSTMRNTLVASASIFLCRLTGVLRELLYNGIFGPGAILDAFNLAFRIPNLLRDLFAEGALSQSYTSVAAKTRKEEGDAAAWELTAKVATQLSTLMVAIVTVGIFFAGPIMDLIMYYNESHVENVGLATGLCRIMWPFIAFASLSALVMGALNIVGVFGLPMLASAVFNVVSVLTGVGFAYYIDPDFGERAIYGFAIGVLAGGLAQLLVQLPRLRKAGFKWRFNFNWRDRKVYKIWGLMLPSVVASGVTQFNVVINSMFAVGVGAGAVTSLANAFKLWQLPVGLFGVATGMVVLPAVSRMMVGDGRGEVSEHIAKALRFVAFFAVPSLVFFVILGQEIVSVIFQRGKFSISDSIYTGNILAAYSIGLLGYAGTKVIQPVFLALEKRWVPLIVSLLALAVSVSLNYTFVRVFHKDASWLAFSTSIITTLNFLFYFVYLRKQLGGICGRMLVSGLFRIVGAGGVLAGVCWGMKELTMDGFLEWSFWGRFFVLVFAGCVGGVAYAGVAWVLKAPELDLLKAKFAQRR